MAVNSSPRRGVVKPLWAAALIVGALVRATCAMRLGMNLAGVTYYDAGIPFKDVFKMASPFGLAADGVTPLPLDADGFVTAIPANVTHSPKVQTLGPPITGHSCSNASGTNRWCSDPAPLTWEMYWFVYEGNCSGCVVNDADGHVLDRTSHGKWAVNVSGQWHMKIDAIDPSDYPRAFKLFPQRFDPAGVEADPWNPAWVRLFANFSTFRFMDWGNTNDAFRRNATTWADRPRPTAATQMNQAGGGVALEYMIALVNKLKVDPWINIPHNADDDYVTQLAQFVKSTVDPSLTTYIEFSNEVWNFGFKQYNYAAQKGYEAGFDSQPSERSANRWYSDRVCQIASIFDNVFGGAAPAHTRLNRVMGTWTNVAPNGSGFAVTENVLTWHDNHRCVDSVAVTGYFGIGKDSSGKSWDTCWLANRTVDEFIAVWNNESQWQQWIAVHAAQADYIKTFGMDLVAYESGLGLAGTPRDPCSEGFAAVIPKVLRDPRVQAMAYRNVAEFAKFNATLMNIFSSVGWSGQIFGDWGQLEYMDSAGSGGGYKYAGVVQWLDEHPHMRT